MTTAGTLRKLDDIEIAGFATLLGGAGAETVTKLVGSAVVDVRAVTPMQWQKLLDDRSKIPAAVEELLRYVGPRRSTNVRYSVKDVERAQRHHPGEQAGVPDGRRRQPRSVAPSTDADDVRHRPATAPQAQNPVLATASTAASAPRWPAWKARSRWNTCSTSCRATRSTSTICSVSTMQNVAGLSERAGEELAMSKVEVDFGLCESNGMCMGIIPEVFDLDDEDYLHVLQDEVTPENEDQIREARPAVPAPRSPSAR